MPKIDSHTGCQVMTPAEFWAHEAAQEGLGRSGSDLAGEFADDLEAEHDREVARLREPQVALELLQEAVKEWNEADPSYEPIPMPEAVLEVLEAEVKMSVRENSSRIVARVPGGTLTVETSSYGGGWDEPPGYEVNVEWVPN